MIGFTGVIHMGKIKTGVSSGLRIAQGRVIEMKVCNSKNNNMVYNLSWHGDGFGPGSNIG